MIFFSFNCIFLHSQNFYVDYVGIFSDEVDVNMSKMTSDLYFTQLSEIENFIVTDKRSDLIKNVSDIDLLETQKIIFYAQISKSQKDEKWNLKLCAVKKSENSSFSKEKTFDSFYQILTQSKDSLKDSIKQVFLFENPVIFTKNEDFLDNLVNQNSNKEKITYNSTEFLSGVWTGENSVEKIVIMRGGRGFIVFENGASMNILVELQNIQNEQKIVITQKGKPNASFFTEINRELALKAAISAIPIKWIFSTENPNILTGEKQTLIENNGGFSQGKINVTWKREE